jgi:hypothetical protein
LGVVLGEQLNARIYPDWAAEQNHGVRAACADPAVTVTVAVDETDVLGFVPALPLVRYYRTITSGRAPVGSG